LKRPDAGTRSPRRPAAPSGAPILRLEAAAALVGRLRRSAPPVGSRGGRRPVLVLANGLFDLPHVGHLRYLRGARRLGDLLIVAVNDDRSARRLRGPGRPLIPAADRARLVSAVRGVDAVVLFGGSTVARVIRRLRPDVHCKGTDYAPATVPEADLVRSLGGVVKVAGDAKRHATTDLISRIAAAGTDRPRRS
jgi:D-glycero-beta-D-manno-heptose 1-phosphate adenylyltransferase